ncbi:hypothetical protein LPE509_02934 [Legionella pneumophila subsp. pneumophila LPE509]|nr:hypothetical protein LPE509_02934 [Legionella pneumophila subsp. pneumophila LPE509]
MFFNYKIILLIAQIALYFKQRISGLTLTGFTQNHKGH